jgi:type I restriction enzyme S subunit
MAVPPLTDLARLESGHTPSRSRPDWWGGDIPWIALPDIRALDGKVAMTTVENTNADGIANSAARVLPAGTVVLSRTASVGFVTIMGRPMATSQDFFDWVCGPDLDPWFLMYLFQASRDYFRSLSSGATHKTVYFPTAEALHVCVPPIAGQRCIAAALQDQMAAAERARVAAQEQLKAIEALPGVLLGRAFRGELGDGQ